jgi:rsbT co-antagonist protein RsbR
MPQDGRTGLLELLKGNQTELLSDWTQRQVAELSTAGHGLQERQIREESSQFLDALREALERTDGRYISAPEFGRVREILESICAARLNQGFTPSEVATFVFSAKQPVFERLRVAAGNDTNVLAANIWWATELFDKLGLFTTEVYQKTRNQVIARQQEEMLELSTPVVQLWEGVLAVPLIGTLDSARTQVVMQNLLESIVSNEAEIAIIDITGVPTVDTLVAQHLLKTVAAARLMGADCIISGIRPQIAQTIIHLGVDLANVTTKATLADAFSVALRRSGMSVVRGKKPAVNAALTGSEGL